MIRFCLAFLVFSGSVVAPSSAEVLTIVTPANAPRAVLTARDELIEHIEKLVGVRPPVATEGEALDGRGRAIYLGATTFALTNGLDAARLSEEAWRVREVEGNLVILGGSARGTLYGVYHYLEDACGVHWLSPAPDGTHIPRLAELPWSGLDLSGEPAMPYRDVYEVPPPGGSEFLARNRANVKAAKWGGGAVFGGVRACHTIYWNLGDRTYLRQLYAEHPEYFPLIDGVRTCDLSGKGDACRTQLCLTNPDLRVLWVEKLRERIRADVLNCRKEGLTLPRYYAVDQNDSYDGFCRCANCAALVAREGGNSGLLLDFVNFVAERLEDEAPWARFMMMAIHTTEKPPRFLKARRNVCVRLCDTTSNVLKPWTDSGNAVHFDNLKGWTTVTDRIAMWDYSVVYGSDMYVNHPIPNEWTFGHDLRTLRDNNGEGVFFEHEHPVSADLRDLKVWVELKLAENPDLDDKDLVRTFTDCYYGPSAGAEIRLWRTYLAEQSHARNARLTWCPRLVDYSYLDPETMSRSYEFRARALAAAADERTRTRVEHAFLSLDRYALVRGDTLRRAAEKTGARCEWPDRNELQERYRRIVLREVGARGYAKDCREVKKIETFLKAIAARRELPVPETFKNVPSARLNLISAAQGLIWRPGCSLVEDWTTAAGQAMRNAVADVKDHVDYKPSAFECPFRWSVWPTLQGEKGEGGRMKDMPKVRPDGYRWYKCAEGVQLTQSSCIAFFPGWYVQLEGLISDPSELGRKFDIWVSLKVEGGDCFASGKAGDDNVFYIDQVAVVEVTEDAGRK